VNIKRLLGIDNLSEKYSYGEDPEFGYMASGKIPERWVRTTCGYCSVGCGMLVGVRDGRAIAVRGDAQHPVNKGRLCPKGLSEHHMIRSKDRALHPLMRGTRISWDDAIDTMVSKFTSIQERYGKQSLGIISTGQLVTEEFYALGKLAQVGFGTSNYCGNTTLCMASAVSGYKRTFGSDGPPGAYEDLEKADVIFLIGANIAENHPILVQRLNPNAMLIVADPRVTKTAMLADIHLPLKPRSDIALLNGIAHILIETGMIDIAYIQAHTEGFSELRKYLKPFTPSYVSALTGLSTDLIARVASLYGRSGSAFIGWTMGVNHSTQGAETVNAINNLALLTGKIGKPGSAPFSITGQCNAMGTREAGGTSSLPGYRKFESRADREQLARLWNIDVQELPTARGLAYPDIIEAAAEGKIKALWFIATNPMVSYPDTATLEKAFANVEFLVVQDGFHPTPTTERADLVLPAAIWGEKEGTYTNSERRCSKVNKAVEPMGESLSDFDIFLKIAKRLGCSDRLYPNWTSPRDAFNEWRRVSEGRLCDYSGMTYELIEEHGGLQWPFPEGSAPGVKRLYEDGVFEHEDGRAKLFCIACEPFPDQPDKDFPFVFNTGRTVEHWHTRTKTANVPILDRLSPHSWLEINPTDANRLGLRPHDRVDVVSRRNRVNNVPLRLTEIIAPGQVFMPFHFPEHNSNLVTQAAFDPISREPNYKQCAVRVERAQPDSGGKR
jgi:anaerobic selenocysteine-containing dehydrogenase